MHLLHRTVRTLLFLAKRTNSPPWKPRCYGSRHPNPHDEAGVFHHHLASATEGTGPTSSALLARPHRRRHGPSASHTIRSGRRHTGRRGAYKGFGKGAELTPRGSAPFLRTAGGRHAVLPSGRINHSVHNNQEHLFFLKKTQSTKNKNKKTTVQPTVILISLASVFLFEPGGGIGARAVSCVRGAPRPRPSRPARLRQRAFRHFAVYLSLSLCLSIVPAQAGPKRKKNGARQKHPPACKTRARCENLERKLSGMSSHVSRGG